MDFFGKEKGLPSENSNITSSSKFTSKACNEINRTTREKSFQTLEDIKRNNSKLEPVPIDNIREFLQETNTSFCSEFASFIKKF